MHNNQSVEQILKDNPKWTYVRTDRNGTRYFNNHTCPRCGGRGGWEGWPGFTCYECFGSGKVDKGETIKVYTDEHFAKLTAQREARAKKREEERIANAIANRAENLKKQGFTQQGTEWVIYRVIGNTYEIKDELKACGCKFNPTVGWYGDQTLEEKYECQRMTEKEVLEDSPFVSWKAKEEVAPLLYENLNKKEETSEWQGNIGEKIEIEVTVEKVFTFDGRFGTSHIILMRDANENIYKWCTTKTLEENHTYKLRTTIKDHAEYKGAKQTVVTRATII